MQISSPMYQAAFIVGGISGLAVGTRLDEAPAAVIATTGGVLAAVNILSSELPQAVRGPLALAGALGGAVAVGGIIGLSVRDGAA